jgi:hypothetical protein
VTPKYPHGWLVCIALVAVVCNKPAAHKLGGFGSHSHTYFCTLCWITQTDKATPKAFVENGEIFILNISSLSEHIIKGFWNTTMKHIANFKQTT